MRKCSENFVQHWLNSVSMGWGQLWAGCAQGSTAGWWKSQDYSPPGLPDLKAHTCWPGSSIASPSVSLSSSYWPRETFFLVPVVHCTSSGFTFSGKSGHCTLVPVSSFVELVSPPIRSALEQKPCAPTVWALGIHVGLPAVCPAMSCCGWRAQPHLCGSEGGGWFQLRPRKR